MIGRIFVNRNKTLLVELDELEKNFVIYKIHIDRRPFSEFPIGTVVKQSKTEFDLDFTELVNIDVLIMEEMVNKVFNEVSSKLAILKIDILRRLHRE